jgi:xanthine dehydrogenase accessory factor
MADFHDLLDSIMEIDQPCAMATIIQVDGSSYRKRGSSMLFFGDGSWIGLLSGGCLEQDLAHSALNCMNSGKSRLVSYDLRVENDLTWGAGPGCNGNIRVLIEPIDAVYKQELQVVQNWLSEGIAVVGLKQWDQVGNVYKTSFFPAENEALPKVSSNQYVQLFQPKPKLFLFGAGPDARPLSKFAKEAGFYVYVCDWRPEFCKKEYFPTAAVCQLGFPSELAEALPITSNDAIVLMTHHFQKDRELVNLLFDKPVRYFGILGPRERTNRLMQGVSIPSWLHSPVGLSIGAEGPEEIAVSIVAELIQTFRQGVNKEKG